MHNAGYRYLGIDAVYEFLPTSSNEFPGVLSAMHDGMLNGVNVTMPHKHRAFAAADSADAAAGRLRAANTMTILDGVVHVYNTDVDGVRHAFDRIGVNRNMSVCVLGSGAAAAAALVALEDRPSIFISGRSSERAMSLCDQIRVDATVIPWGDVAAGSVLVNATPVGMQGESLPQGVVEASTGVLDMAYGAKTTPAIATAIHLSIPHADGLVMLAGQAQRAFKLFTGKDVPIRVLERAAREPLRPDR
jgi:shikimate dehydrogenase